MLKTKTTSQYTLTSNGTKAVSFNNIPQEAWTSIFGESNEDIYKLYKAVPWLYRAIQVTCDAITSIPFNHEDFENANIRVNFADFLSEIVGDYLLRGAMFCILESNRFGKNMELRRFHPDLMKLKLDDKQGLNGFKRKVGNDEVMYKREELGYSWIPSREKELAIGTAPAMAAMAAAGLLFNIDEYGQKYFKSGAINPTLVEIEDFHTMADAEQERTRSIFKRMLQGGVKKAFEVFPVGSNTKVHNIGSPMSELGIPELTNQKREDISTALGIPQSILFSNASTFATADKDDQHFYQKTVIPIARKIEGMLNPYFLTKGINYQLKFYEQEMDIFQEDEARRSDSLRNLTATGIPLITAMEILGYDLTDEQWAELRKIDETEEIPMISEAPPIEEDNEIITVRSFKPVESIATHLDMWQRKAKKAYKKHGNAAIEFESDLIPSTLSAAIKGHLDEVKHNDDIADVFNHAVNLSDHHHEGIY